jgi:hypothetical protein
MFTEFPPVSREDWEAEAGRTSPQVLYGPPGVAAAPQPWRPAEWEILEDIPEGLFELPEAAPALQLRAALASGSTEFLVPIDTQYFEEIAKVRALRRLFDAPIRIVAITSRAHQTIYDPHVNLLRATTCAMSAILGGCDALVVRRFDEARGGDAGELARRLAVNTQLLLREEAGFGSLTDPAAGSWYLESLTQELVEAARGNESAKPARRRELVGVTKYADPEESAPVGAIVTEGRDAAPYEKVRLAVERSGRRPRIRLILGQDAKMSRARADFARNVFHAGGFAIGEPADFGVVCAADAEYPALIAVETNLPLIVAGPETAGAFDFVNLKSDIPAKLAAWHSHIGEPNQP